jgi:uncharacterized protein YnzC (UPF0291/DUF896 family)
MDQKRIDRISELTRKSRTPEGLTEAEQQERTELRAEYVRAVTGNLELQLEHVVVQEPDGTRHPLEKREGKA